MYDVSSWHLRKRIELDCMHFMRTRSLRDVVAIIFVRHVLSRNVYFVRGVEYVHGVRSRKVRAGQWSEHVRRMSERYEK